MAIRKRGIVSAMRSPFRGNPGDFRDKCGEPAISRQVVLHLLLEILSRYERGGEELRNEFDLPEITSELLMQVCLAAAEVDDLVLGFIRDDLRIVSLSDQTRRMVDRDIGFLA